MTTDEINTMINDLETANAALAAKMKDLQARVVMTDQQAADLKAAVEATVSLGKS
jgi:predicted  nucleic acid-binding Zn-ribbon protein